MSLREAAVVVTGAGRGIGAALARRFAEEGARVVVNDRHPERAEEVAGEIGGIALPGDASRSLVPEALRLLGGRIDVYCANAGAVRTGGPEAPDEDWASAWEVNVMAHVRAARDLLPGWLERGQGRFVSVVSSAALLTMVGAAPYAVSKHGALAFAEWLSLTYRHRGVRVHAVCPRGVRTEMRRAASSSGLTLTSTAIGPEEVADALLKGIADERFLILPHPEVADQAAERVTDHERWLEVVNGFQRQREST
ncbi:SDR family oxidoreductase [Streptosporangium saharense]|uniref:NAD(P)-dependent dehydrogenase (Short-subunit alcohol dehydrogenase family) n=1 Tax=Streptosporangium saharense TaxID=1706840 RepID=A0A7W7VLD3_9ACTN|nr:SDR family oxidoreductase [Streptosporangium saharense]MBB4914279.1 NAD(P)-dependent dehydrogenase (short-subunit alcohol dehydrogenase family) [Streptosporangium saharense]